MVAHFQGQTVIVSGKVASDRCEHFKQITKKKDMLCTDFCTKSIGKTWENVIYTGLCHPVL